MDRLDPGRTQARFYDDPRVLSLLPALRRKLMRGEITAVRAAELSCCDLHQIPAISPKKLMIQKIDHLGIAVKSLDEAIPYYENALGLKCEHREEVASQKVRTAFFTAAKSTSNSWSPRTRRARSRSSSKRTPRAASITSRSAPTTSRRSSSRRSAAGVKLIHEKPFDGAGGKLVAFLHPKSTYGVLTEFCMPKPGNAARET